MKVSIELRNNWKIYAEHGDAQAISDESIYSRQTISKALNDKEGKMSEDVFKAIDTFYAKRKQSLIEAAKEVATK